jgi:hypothetical protein
MQNEQRTASAPKRPVALTRPVIISSTGSYDCTWDVLAGGSG